METVKISSIFAIIVILLSSIFLAVYLRFELPDTTPNLIIPTLETNVSVTQDQYGFYHVIADSQQNGLKAEGYLMARDRLWQMDFYRREAEGKLSEIFYQYDQSILDTDYSLRALGFYRIAERDWPGFTADTKTFYQAFTDGVNLFIHENGNKLPIEFSILNYLPSEWSPLDTIAILKLMAFGLNAHGGGEPIIGQALSFMNQTKLLDFVRLALDNNNITWSDPVAYPIFHEKKGSKTVSSTSITSNTTTSSGTNTSSLLDYIMSEFSFVSNIDSNNWVVSGNNTVTGKAMLANDPHLPLETPGRWWFVDLKTPDFHITGETLPGIPGIVLGRNDFVMWGFTNTQIDYLDTYVETFSNNYTKYLYNGTWLNTTIIPEKFYTSHSSFVIRNIYITEGYNNVTHGLRPVVPMIGLNSTVRWTAQDSTNAAQALVIMMTAKSRLDFVNALQLFDSPGQNVVYADNIGNIGLFVTGTIPIRPSYDYGIVPHNGSISKYDWLGLSPKNASYQILNPIQGFIATANNHFIPESYPYFLGYAFDSPYRIDRITELLNVNTKISYEYIESMQNDVTSLFAKAVVPKILIPSSDSRILALENNLAHWDYTYDINSTAGPILALFTNYFLNFTYGDDFQNNFLDKIPLQGKLTENTLNLPQNSSWFNNVKTGKNQTKNDVILLAYNAVKAYYVSHSISIENFTWGQLHEVQFNHVLGNTLNFFNAAGLQSSPGDKYTVNVGTYNDAFIQTDGPSMRQIMGMDANKTFLVIIPPGESGIVGQAHYADQISRWLEGNYCVVIVRSK